MITQTVLDNREYIKTLPPLKPSDFDFMEKGTPIIHESSQILKPDLFIKFCDNDFGVEVVYYESGHDYKTYELTPSGWHLWSEKVTNSTTCRT